MALHICINQNRNVMKKRLLPLLLGLLTSTSLWAQLNPNDLFISGYVTNASGAAVNGQQVCVTLNNPANDTLCVQTNANGWYFINIPGGSTTGPNQIFDVITYEMCNGMVNVLSSSVSNQQGTVDTASVNFTLACNPNGGGGGGCNCAAYISAGSNGLFNTYTATVGCGSAPYTYTWWMPDGSSQTGQTVQYDTLNLSAGAYGICAVIADANGCSWTACDTIYVGGGGGGGNGCTASFQYDSNPNGGVTAGSATQFYFTGSSTDPNNSSYYWSVTGGGIQLTYYGANPSITFPSGGTYYVCASVIDSTAMCYDEFCANVSVGGNGSGGCQAYFTAMDSANVAMYFYNQSQGSGLSYAWDFGDGTTSTEQNPWHSFNNVGTYNVCLTISNGTCSDTYCDNVNFGGGGGGGCDATFSFSQNPAGGYTFAASGANVMGQFLWNFGDGSNGSGITVNHTFASAGVYNVCLTAYTLNGQSCTECMTVVTDSTGCYNYFGGQVFAGNTSTPVDFATVYLITFDANTNMLTAVQTTSADSMGYYWFGLVECGDYLVKAATGPNSAYYNSHLPTYYGNSPFWNFADEITVSASGPAVQYVITLIAGNNPGGPGFIGGDVTQGANKMEDVGDPIANVAVEVFDMSGNAVKYTYTDAQGDFNLDDLAYGTYQVYVEVLGVPCTPAVVTLSAQTPGVSDLSFYVNSDMVATGIDEATVVSITGAYPNPANDRLTLGLDARTAAQGTLTVSDLTGREVVASNVSIAAGANSITVDVSALTPGVYVLSLQPVGSSVVTERFMKAD